MFISQIWNALLIYLYPMRLSDRRVVLIITISLLASYAVPIEMLVYFLCLVVACLMVSKSVLSEKQDFLAGDQTFSGRLYPRESETREVRSLDGLWNFRLSPPDPEHGFRNEWFKQDLAKTGPVIKMPVPSSYNDITEDASIRDHVGIVWYDRRFYTPESWRRYEQLVWLRFGSVNYAAKVWVNGVPVMQHEMGHLPFEQDITRYLKYGESNLVTVACDNVLLNDTVPQGNVNKYGGEIYQSYTFDFFNYAGIHRPVHLYTTPTMFISDIHVHTDIQGDTGLIEYSISCSGFVPPSQPVVYQVQVLEKNGEVIAEQGSTGTGVVEIPDARLWWPYLMDADFGYLYTLRVSLIVNNVMDVYSLRVGIRTITWSNTSVLLNNKPLYMRGFGMHEDSDIRGKGLDLALYIKNYNLIHWVGANTYRTSHYPYAEEQYDLADELGIMVIDECPSVDTDLFSRPLLKKHMESLTQLINRDKNHPSVIMWSIANEPRTQKIASGKYFGFVADHVRSMDTSRPITIALAQSFEADQAGQHLDVISFNRYNGWYHAPGDLKTITRNVINEARSWHKKYQKPVLMSEYGADTMEGLHLFPEYIWSEEYQVSLMSQHFKAFDALRQEKFFIGEFIWNFADFKTAQTYTRVGGNKKGIFTRQRQPKASAHHLRVRYHELANSLDGATLPTNLHSYTSNGKSSAMEKYEL